MKNNRRHRGKTFVPKHPGWKPEFECFFDGACEPINPGGTASYGAIIYKHRGEKVWECAKLFSPEKGCEGDTSNNVAEYSGLISILEYFLENQLNHSAILICGDSNLVIQQMFGSWKIRAGYYKSLAHRAKLLAGKFPKLTGKWIPREQNSIADELSKRALIEVGVRFKLQPK